MKNNAQDLAHAARQKVAAQLAESFESFYEHSMSIDAQHKITWISEGYQKFLELKHAPIGEPVTRYVPNSHMPKVVDTGQPVFLDLLHIRQQWVLVSAIPLKDSDDQITGAFGFVAVDDSTRFGTLAKRFNSLQKQLDKVTSELIQARQPKYRLSQITGRSEVLMAVKHQIRQAARFDISVLLTGETGTGKELFAHALHELSDRMEKPFISLNVAAIPDNLIEAEFFGVAPGAYTGANKEGRKGKLELAHQGTLFLDEIGDMPLELQGKLLRALQEQEFEAVGSNKVKKVDVRIVAATSRDLPQMVENGEFRSDLFYRLNAMPVHLPPLRDRLEDLDLIAERILDDLSQKLNLPPKILTQGAVRMLTAHTWPGNIRELRNILERAVVLSEEQPEITAALVQQLLTSNPRALKKQTPHIDDTHATSPIGRLADTRIRPNSLKEQIRFTEQQAIQKALDFTQGHKGKAAEILGISRAAFYRKLTELGFNSSQRENQNW